MKPHLACVSLLVREYDEAIAYYTRVLGFRVLEDTPLSPTKRWVTVQPRGGGCSLLLAQARGRRQLAAVGRQSGERVFLFLHTDNFRRDHRALRRRGVRFEESPRHESYGTVAVFTDLYGNRWDLIEPSASPRARRRHPASGLR